MHPQQIQERKENMKIWRFCVPILVCSGLLIAFVQGGCGDNPCERAEPDTCALIPFTAPNTCVLSASTDDDFACKCCNPDDGPCEPPDEDRCFQWIEEEHVCREITGGC
jgi:hypothetical protein